jgi:hypothetical protein
MKYRVVVILAASACLFAARAGAHHSFAATYFEDKTETIEGTLVQFIFRNPHSFVHVEAPDDNGQMVRGAVEWAATAQLKEAGVDYQSLKPGDHVIVTGNPGRNPADHRLRMRSVERPKDGWKWSGTVQ